MPVTKAMVKKLFPPREAWSHKGDYGRLLVIGGSRLYSGAPALAALAALRAGAGVVKVLAPRRAADIIASFAPDLIAFPVRGDFLNSWHLPDAFRLLEEADAAVLGGGVEQRRETAMFAEKFLEKNRKPVVVDADAIQVVGNRKDLAHEKMVITPHAQEFFQLTGVQPTDLVKERMGMVERFAKELGCTILLKGAVDVISDGKHTLANETGTPFLAKGGTGDVLAGVCGALLARGASPFEAGCAAAWMNGTAGQMAAKGRGEGLLASDLLPYLAQAILGK
ncbi:MAG: NAD(P)H-hydrate dehydratase [Candidatus Aenigmarchaeota archaeon]|nr:NAD(P)H-hydrate dehydratase [Candidatus Aenigmarchaeota archaeon]